ncbi:hypothetical protein HZD82_24065, partial [Pantoea agglomerans]|nr:hypothetical protein [Pantoea agglomerans]
SFSGWREEGERLVGMIIRDVTARYESEARLCELASLDMLTLNLRPFIPTRS